MDKTASFRDPSDRAFTRTQFTWLTYLLMGFFSYFINILGPITPFLKDELHLSYTVSSLHFSAFAGGMLLMGLFGHFLIQRTGRRIALWIGLYGMSLSALLLVAGRTPILTVGASFCMGITGSLILAIVPSALSDQHGEQRAVALAESNVAGSLVGAAGPLLVGWFVLFTGGWRLALIAAAFASILVGVIFRKASFSQDASKEEKNALTAAPLPAQYWVYWVAILLAVSVEFCMIFWSADFLEHSLGMLKVGAAQSVSLFLAGMIAGRFAGSRLVQHFSTQKLVLAFILVASAGFLLYWRSETVFLGLGGLFITGLGVASLYPLTLALAIGSAHGNTVQAGARATLASGAAVLILPLVLGRLADALGIRLAYSVVAVVLVCLFLTILFAERRSPAVRPAAVP